MTHSLKAILFDADGVIINPPMQFARYLQTTLGITPEMTRGFFRGIFTECLLGRAELASVLPPYLQEWGWRGTVEGFIDLWMEQDNLSDPRLLAAVQKIRQRGVLCGLATLQERNRAGYMARQMGFERLFDRLFFSCHLGCLKPDPAFYRLIQQELNLRGEEILFWDDNQANVTAAADFGWNARLYTTFEEFARAMQPLGLC